jgi:hypothetical protein
MQFFEAAANLLDWFSAQVVSTGIVFPWLKPQDYMRVCFKQF